METSKSPISHKISKSKGVERDALFEIGASISRCFVEIFQPLNDGHHACPFASCAGMSGKLRKSMSNVSAAIEALHEAKKFGSVAHMRNGMLYLSRLIPSLDGPVQDALNPTKRKSSLVEDHQAMERFLQHMREANRCAVEVFADKKGQTSLARLEALQVMLFCDTLEHWKEPRVQIRTWSSCLELLFSDKDFQNTIRTHFSGSLIRRVSTSPDNTTQIYNGIVAFLQDLELMLFKVYLHNSDAEAEKSLMEVLEKMSGKAWIADKSRNFHRMFTEYPFSVQAGRPVRHFKNFLSCSPFSDNSVLLGTGSGLVVRRLISGQKTGELSFHGFGQVSSLQDGSVLIGEEERGVGVRLRRMTGVQPDNDWVHYPGQSLHFIRNLKAADPETFVLLCENQEREKGLHIISRKDLNSFPAKPILLAARSGDEGVEVVSQDNDGIYVSLYAKDRLLRHNCIQELYQKSICQAAFCSVTRKLGILLMQVETGQSKFGFTTDAACSGVTQWNGFTLDKGYRPTGIALMSGMLCVTSKQI